MIIWLLFNQKHKLSCPVVSAVPSIRLNFSWITLRNLHKTSSSSWIANWKSSCIGMRWETFKTCFNSIWKRENICPFSRVDSCEFKIKDCQLSIYQQGASIIVNRYMLNLRLRMSTYIRSREIVEMAIAVPYANETRIVKANDFNLRNFASNLNYLKHLRLRISSN